MIIGFLTGSKQKNGSNNKIFVIEEKHLKNTGVSCKMFIGLCGF